MALDQLIQNLDEQVKVYRHLLDVVRKEKEILISANLDDLNENNKSKEAMLIKIRSLETSRIELAKKIGDSLGMESSAPRLLDIAVRLDETSGDRLRSMHSVLELLLKRVQEHNRKNEVLVQSALANVTGAMNNLKNVLEDKKTYERKGEKAKPANIAGQLVSREA
ncbi:MAG: flagellar protein FlgN [Bdellovibrionales bacterium]|nr:flagellar protein FlgN [Bdellovibrionales bacterium]